MKPPIYKRDFALTSTTLFFASSKKAKKLWTYVSLIFLLRVTSLACTASINDLDAIKSTTSEQSIAISETSNITLLRGDISAGSHTPLTITRPGAYRLAGPLRATGNNAALIITANNVSLDLAGQTISGGQTGINITGNQVAVKNGTIQNTSSTGITIAGSQCQIEELVVLNSSTGFLIHNTNTATLTNCRALQSTSAGFSLVSSYTNALTNCQALNTASTTGNAYGFIAQFGSGNTFVHCYAQGTQTLATNGTPQAAGFLLVSEQVSTVRQSQASDTRAIAPNATAYGIFLQDTDNCICEQNSVSTTQTDYGHGIGLRAQSNANYVVKNTAYNNNINYQDIESTYITSQANARGLSNINAAAPDPDMLQTTSSNVSLIGDQQIAIASMYATANSQLDILEPLLNDETWSIESKVDVMNSTVDTWVPTMNSSSSKIDVLLTCPSTPIITNGTTTPTKQIISGAITITQPGSYCLSNHCAGGLTIDTHNVTLDLNNYTISGGTTGLTITNNGTNAQVRNGTIKNATQNGVSLAASTCTLENLDVIGSPTGYYLNSAAYNRLTHCRALNCTQNGFYLSECQKNKLTDCAVTNVGGATAESRTVSGFLAKNGSSNTFDTCTVSNAYTNYASAAGAAHGFRLVAEDYDTITNCSINGVSTTQSTSPNIPALYGIRAPLTQVQELKYAPGGSRAGRAVAWLEAQNSRYLAIGFDSQTTPPYEITILKYTGTQLLYQTSVDWATSVKSTSWLTAGEAYYLAIASESNGTGNNEVQILQFTPPNILTSIVGYDHGATMNHVDWLTTCSAGTPKYYLASGGISTGGINVRVHRFNLDISTLTQTSSYNTGYSAEAVSWLTVGPDAYLAIGSSSDATNEIVILKYPFTPSSTPIASVALTSSVYSARWLTTTNGKYYLAVGAGGATPQILVYKFTLTSPTTATLTPIVSYLHGASIYSVSWLPGIDDLNYLAIGGNAMDGYQTRILRFDGSCLTPIFNYTTDTSGTLASEIDWLRTSSTILAISSFNTTNSVATLSFSPTRNILKNNRVTNIHGSDQSRIDVAAFAVDANNLMINNVAYNNDQNYYYTPAYGDTNRGFAQGQAALET